MGFISWSVAFMKIVINHSICIQLLYCHFLNQLPNIRKLQHWLEVLEIFHEEKRCHWCNFVWILHNTIGKGLVYSGWIYISNNHPLETHLFVSFSTLIGLSNITDSWAHIIVHMLCLICKYKMSVLFSICHTFLYILWLLWWW